MRAHPYLRAYMAGIAVPTLFLILVVVLSAFQRYYFEVPSQFVIPLPSAPLARAYLFPMAVVPNAWGVWNMLFVAVSKRWPRRVSIGLFGSLLVLLMIPGGAALARIFDEFTIQMRFAVPMVPVGMAVYYLAWKHLVSRLNAELGIADA